MSIEQKLLSDQKGTGTCITILLIWKNSGLHLHMASPSSEPTAKPEDGKGDDVGGGETSGAVGTIGIDHLLLYIIVQRTEESKEERVCTAKDRISKMPPCTAGKRSSISWCH